MNEEDPVSPAIEITAEEHLYFMALEDGLPNS